MIAIMDWQNQLVKQARDTKSESLLPSVNTGLDDRSANYQDRIIFMNVLCKRLKVHLRVIFDRIPLVKWAGMIPCYSFIMLQEYLCVICKFPVHFKVPILFM